MNAAVYAPNAVIHHYHPLFQIQIAIHDCSVPEIGVGRGNRKSLHTLHPLHEEVGIGVYKQPRNDLSPIHLSGQSHRLDAGESVRCVITTTYGGAVPPTVGTIATPARRRGVGPCSVSGHGRSVTTTVTTGSESLCSQRFPLPCSAEGGIS
jgi:hypothetical protein